MSQRPLWWFRSPSITTPLSFITYILCLLSSTLQVSSHIWPSDNIEELFKPFTILVMVTAGDSVLGSGREPCFFACDVPASRIIIIGPVALTIFPKQCWYYFIMKWMDAPMTPFNITMVLIMFNISFWVFSRDNSSVVWFIYLLIHTNNIPPNNSAMSSFKPSCRSAHTLCISSLILVSLLLGVAIISYIKTWSACPSVFESPYWFLPKG